MGVGRGRGGERWVTTKFGSSDAPLDQTKRQTIGRQVSDHWWISFWGHKSSQIKTRFRFQKLLQKFKHTISLRNLQSIHGSEVEACSYWKKPRVSVVFVAFQQFMSFLSSLQELTRNDSFKHCQKKCYIHLPDVSLHVIRIWRTLDWRCQSVTTSMKGVWCALARLGAELSGREGGGGRGGTILRGEEGVWGGADYSTRSLSNCFTTLFVLGMGWD